MRRMVSILGRERDLEPGEFGLEFGFGGLVDEGQLTPVLATQLELLDAKTGLAVLNEGVPAFSDCDRFSSHKD